MSLILNSPYESPTRYWRHTDDQLVVADGRRAAGYMVADPAARPHQHRGTFVSLPLVNQIRQQVDAWRAAGYVGVTGMTKQLLSHWWDMEQREYPFFFCQLEAIETLIWLVEVNRGAEAIVIPDDGGAFQRLCAKLATGTGKTVVMAMLIAWQAINRTTYRDDARFAKDVLVMAPNLTVKERLAVLQPAAPDNYYAEFGVVPVAMRESLLQGTVLIRNWHALAWDSQQQLNAKRAKGQLRSVDKRKLTVRSDAAYIKQVFGPELAHARQLMVINDEAHHAWRMVDSDSSAKSQLVGVEKTEIEEATVWVNGLDRIHRTRGIARCFDFSATPFTPNGRKTAEDALFPWIVSDFGLNDAIEAGLVKTPRVVVRDDTLVDKKTFQSRLYHLYNDEEVKDDLNRKAEPHEPLPALLTNAYALLGADWEHTRKCWQQNNTRETPPVMITVANRTETAARIKHAFESKHILIDALCDSDRILHVDSKVLASAEAETADTRTVSQKEHAEQLRAQVNSVGQLGKPGALIQNVISVGMLSEGWDARTVTHIMGLRAFTSQLLCEQVIGRGLRRAAYEINPDTGLFEAEYVNVFGVPFSFLPHEYDGPPPPPPRLKTTVMPLAVRQTYAIRWPHVLRITHDYGTQLALDWEQVEPLVIDTAAMPQLAEIAPTVDGKPDVKQIKDLDLAALLNERRCQQIIFSVARDLWQEMQPHWRGTREVLIGQLVGIVERLIARGAITIIPELFNQDRKKRQIVLALNMARLVRHIWAAIRQNNKTRIQPVFDAQHPIRETGEMRAWRTGKPCKLTRKSHVNYCVYDSTWEDSAAFVLEKNKAVAAWVKNDHLGFEVLYVHNGVVRKYRPDFLIRLQSGAMLVLEIKGQLTEQARNKHEFMRDWVAAVNQHGGFGTWQFAVATTPAEVPEVLTSQPSRE